MSLYQRLAVSLCLAFIALALVFIWWSGELNTLSQHQAEQQLHLELAEHLVHENPLLSEGVTDYAALENLFHTQMILGPSFEFYFVDPKGRIMTYSANPKKIKRQTINLTPIYQLMDNPKDLPVYGDDPRNADKQKIFSVASVFTNDQLQGYLYVIIGGEIYDSVFKRFAQDKTYLQMIAMLGGALLILLISMLLLFRILTRPLRQLTHDMQVFRDADFDKNGLNLKQWQNQPNHEIHQLGYSFQELVEQIDAQLKQLQVNDRSRRELLAQLSHDLRTPLSSIQGYIETIELQHDNLSREEIQQYVSVALKSTRQLRKLIEQIFELAHLESGQVSVEMEACPLGELLFDIVAKFALKAADKSITLSVEPAQFDYQVFTDIGKLERVLSNLIDNAIRHTAPGGTVTIKVGETGTRDKLCIHVIDNGCGIAEQDIPYIFNTRYRGTNAVGDKVEHGGFGLAITQKLLALLNSKISVFSQPGQGTEFVFDLQWKH